MLSVSNFRPMSLNMSVTYLCLDRISSNYHPAVGLSHKAWSAPRDTSINIWVQKQLKVRRQPRKNSWLRSLHRRMKQKINCSVRLRSNWELMIRQWWKVIRNLRQWLPIIWESKLGIGKYIILIFLMNDGRPLAISFRVCIRSFSLRKPEKARLTLLRSVHVHKKHRVQYEVRTYFRYLTFHKMTGSTLDTFLEYIERNLPEGVALKATKTEIKRLPEYLNVK